MPTYQYACTECDHDFEQFQRFSDDALTECPSCSGRLRKLFNAVGVVFKGSGFYRNDSRAPDASAEPSSASTETKTDGKSDTKSESKSESKSDGKSDTKSETKKETPKDGKSAKGSTTSSTSS